ncbi:unnamed protein product [Symbiodinium sp. CCMP2592]|nr:unnamed protein product [Symbiodinium sp. CCMP2592]
MPWCPEPDVVQVSVDQEQLDVARSDREGTRTSLSSDTPVNLIRGVAADLCLQGWGTHFDTCASKVNAAKDYQLSQHTDSIEAFLSHDWQTSRFSKTVALLIVFNSIPAAWTSFLLALLCCCLLVLDVFPGGWPLASCLCCCGFYFCLCFWQRIRRLLCVRSTLVFLDRLCIAQHDEDLKQAGILGIAGFLSSSRKLIILWSPQYCSRLWCTFELGAFLRDEESRPIQFIPVSLSLFLLAQSVLISSLWGWSLIISDFEDRATLVSEDTRFAAYLPVLLGFLLPVGVIIQPIMLHYGLRHMRELIAVRDRMANYSIRACECTCCKVDHCDPGTGSEMLCDRKLIFATLRRWYGHSTDTDSHTDELWDPEFYLDRFDRLVRERVASSLLRFDGTRTQVESDFVPLWL